MPKSSGNLWEFLKTSETLQTRYWGTFIKKELWKFWKIFVNLRKLLENFGNSSKVFSTVFMIFWNFSENLPKSWEVFGNLRKISGGDRKCSLWFAGAEEFRSWLLRSPQMVPSKLLRASNDGKVEWNTTCCILLVAYCRICNGNPGLWLAVFFKAWDKIQYDMIWYDMIWYDMIWYDMIWYDMICYAMPFYIVLYCTRLYTMLY